MIVDKQKFKELKKEGGGIFRAIHAFANLEFGVPEIKVGQHLNLYVMTNGIIGDIALGKKLYFSFDSVVDVTASSNKLILDINEYGIESQIVFKIGVKNILKKAYTTIRQNANLGYKEFDTLPIDNIKIEQTISKRQEEKQRIKQLKKEHTPFCSKCHSTNITYIEKRKRLSVGRAVVGGVLLGGAGAVLGGLSSNKLKKGNVKCLNCGHSWKL